MWYQIAVDEGRDLPDPYSFRSKIKFDDMFKQGVFHPHDQLETVVEYEEDGENKNTVVVVEVSFPTDQHEQSSLEDCGS